MQNKVSVCVITLNEEERIRDCLDSVRWADEIVVLDSFSSDQTVPVCREYTDQVVQAKLPSTAARRTAAMECATSEWILALDADERVPPALAEEIVTKLASADLDQFAGFRIPRTTFCLGRWIRHGSWYPNYQLRLTRKTQTQFIDNIPHDVVEVDGRVGRLRQPLEHRAPDTLQDQITKGGQYSTIFAQARHAEGGRAGGITVLSHTVCRFLRNYFLRLGFLDGVPGLIIALLGGFHAFQKYARLWELNNQQARAAKQGARSGTHVDSPPLNERNAVAHPRTRAS